MNPAFARPADHHRGCRRLYRLLLPCRTSFLDRVLYKPTGPNAGRNINRANAIRPWLFLFPALFALGLYLAYPVIETLRLSLTNRVSGGGFEWAGLANYQRMFDEAKFWEAVRNNLLWLLIVARGLHGLRASGRSS